MKSVKSLELPIPYRDTYDVYDSSKIQQFMDCPRKYFINQVLGLTENMPNVHLVFGSAWHEAMDVLFEDGIKESNLDLAVEAFSETYKSDFPTSFGLHGYDSKTMGNARKALKEYIQIYKNMEYELLHTEAAGTVPLDDDIWIVVKMDKILRDRRGVRSFEHKTTGRKSKAWMNKWESITQVGSYDHALRIMFPDEAGGIVIDGMVLRKSGNECVRIPITKTQDQWQLWLWETKHWAEQIYWNFAQLQAASLNDRALEAFPRNPMSCGHFGCDHPEICNYQCNPLQFIDELPPGYKREFWDPRNKIEETESNINEITGKTQD